MNERMNANRVHSILASLLILVRFNIKGAKILDVIIVRVLAFSFNIYRNNNNKSLNANFDVLYLSVSNSLCHYNMHDGIKTL